MGKQKKQESDERDLQRDFPYLDWSENGVLPLALTPSGKLAYPVRSGAKLPPAVAGQMVGNVLPFSAPAVKLLRDHDNAGVKKKLAKMRREAAEIHASISDPDNDQPIPWGILHTNVELVAWLNGENPKYAPTMTEYKLIYPAFLERRRRIRERGLAGGDLKNPPEKDGPYGHCQWRHNGEVVDGTMQVGAWKVAEFLWTQPGKKASFDDLYEVATCDRNDKDFDFKSSAQKAKKFFGKADIPLRLSVSEKHRTVSLTEKK